MHTIKDPHSFADASEAIVHHIDLDLSVDFERKILFGQAVLAFKKSIDTEKLVLDTKGLKINSVTILRAYKDSVIVSQGLSEGDQIIKTPLSAASDGMLVRVK